MVRTARRPSGSVETGARAGVSDAWRKGRRRLHAPVRWQVGQSTLASRENQCIQGGGERGDRVAGWADHQVVGPVGAVDGSHVAEHRVRVVQEVLVDRHLDAVQLGEPCLLPGGRARRPAWFAVPQDEQVGDDAGAGNRPPGRHYP